MNSPSDIMLQYPSQRHWKHNNLRLSSKVLNVKLKYHSVLESTLAVTSLHRGRDSGTFPSLSEQSCNSTESSWSREPILNAATTVLYMSQLPKVLFYLFPAHLPNFPFSSFCLSFSSLVVMTLKHFYLC